MNYSNVTFVKVLPVKETNNAEYRTIQVKAVETIKNSKTLLLGGSGISKARFALVTITKAQLDAMNLKEGDDFTAAFASLSDDHKAIFGAGGRIRLREITGDIYNKLTEKQRIGWSLKVIPARGDEAEKQLYFNNSPVYQKSEYVAMTDPKVNDHKFSSYTTAAAVEMKAEEVEIAESLEA